MSEKQSVTLPFRIRARAGQCDLCDDKSLIGKWFFEVSVWNVEGTHCMYLLPEFGPYQTQVQAKAAMRAETRRVSDSLAKALTGDEDAKTSAYFDQNQNGVRRLWEEN